MRHEESQNSNDMAVDVDSEREHAREAMHEGGRTLHTTLDSTKSDTPINEGLFGSWQPASWWLSTTNTQLLFDINPTTPAVLSTISAILATSLFFIWWRRRRCDQSGLTRRDGVHFSEEPVKQTSDPASEVSMDKQSLQARHIRSKSTTSLQSPNTNEAPDSAVARARLCEVLYDVYGGKTPEGGIDNKMVRAAGLDNEEIKRRFQSIKEGREMKQIYNEINSETNTAAAAQLALRRRRTLRSQRIAVEPKAHHGPQGSREILSPRTPSSKRSSPKSPSSRASSAKKSSTNTAASPVRQRPGFTTPVNSNNVARATTPRELRSTQAKVEASEKTPSSSRKATPANRKEASLLEHARREARLKADEVASARAETLKANSESVGTRSSTRSKRSKT